MVGVFDLPKDVLWTHVFPFINLNDIGCLDGAMVNHAQRILYLEKLDAFEFSDTGTLELDHDIAYWVTSRKVFVKSVKCSSELRGVSLVLMRARLIGTTSLDLSNCTNITDLDLQCIGMCCFNLRWFSAYACANMTEWALEVVFSYAQKLEFVNIGGLETMRPSADPSFIDRLVSNAGQTLSSFLCSRTYGMNDAAVRLLAVNCPNLRVLDFSQCANITDESMMIVGMCCIQLEKLNVEACDQITTRSIVCIASNCTKLNEINISTMQGVRSPALDAIAMHCSLLRVLAVGRLNISASIGAVIEKCSKLESLFLEYTHIQDVALYAMLHHHQLQLRQLDLSGNIRLSEDAVVAVLQSCGATLRNIQLNAPINVSDYTLIALASFCPHLENIGLKNLQQCTENRLVSLFASCRKVRTLCLSNCCIVTNKVVFTIAQNCPEMRNLDISGCVIITNAILLPLATQCTNLETLNVLHCPSITAQGVDEAVVETFASILY